MTDENLTVKHIRKLVRVILFVQRGLLHDKDCFERHEALAQCAEALVYYSIKLRDSDAALVPLDGDIEFGMKIAEHEARCWGEDAEADAIQKQRLIFQTNLELSVYPPEEMKVKKPKGLDEFLANDNSIASDDLLPGDDMLPDLTTMDDEPVDDLYDGWIWDEKSQGFISDNGYFNQDEDDEPSCKDDRKDGKDHDDKKNND